MSSSIPKSIQSLVTRWREIQSRGGQLDFDIATFAKDARQPFPAWDKFWTFFSETLGERSTSRVRMFIDMADALALVPDPAVWRSVGWAEVRNVARIENAKKRSSACARIVTEAASTKRAKVGPALVDKILAEEAPETFLPKPAVPETKKDREQDRMAAAKKAEAPRSVVEPRFAAFVKRVTSSGYAFVADLLTPDERKAAGLPAPKKKARAS